MRSDTLFSAARAARLPWVALAVAATAISSRALAEEPAPSPPIARAAGHTFSVSALYGALLPGSIRVEGTPYDYGQGHVARFAADFQLVPRLALGGFAHLAKSRYSDVDTLHRMYALGIELVGRSNDPDNPHARVGLTLAWQREQVPSKTADPVGHAEGFGIGGFLEYVLPARRAAVLAHVGFTSQLMSTSLRDETTWVPMFYFGVGAELGK
jgi:hypothetical protein